jgi:hypothetical protein
MAIAFLCFSTVLLPELNLFKRRHKLGNDIVSLFRWDFEPALVMINGWCRTETSHCGALSRIRGEAVYLMAMGFLMRAEGKALSSSSSCRACGC